MGSMRNVSGPYGSPEARVAHVMGKMVGGGLEATVMNYYRNINHSKFQFDFIIDDDSTMVPRQEIESLGGRVIPIPPYQHQMRYQKELSTLFKNEGWKIVHSHLNTLSVFPLFAAARNHVPVRIAHSHATAGKGELARNIMKEALRPFSNLFPTHRFACSEYAGRWLFGSRAEFTVLYNAIDLDKFYFDEEIRFLMRLQLNIPQDGIVIGHLGRLVTTKNHAYLLKMFAAVCSMEQKALLLLAGEGPLREEIAQQAKDLGIEDRVLFLHQQSEPWRIYHVLDAFVMPSLYEGLGLAGIEAEANGLPCFFSNRIPLEVALNDNCFFLSLEEEPEAWANRILSEVSKGRCAVNARSFANYDIHLAARRLEALYSSMLAGALNNGEEG